MWCAEYHVQYSRLNLNNKFILSIVAKFCGVDCCLGRDRCRDDHKWKCDLNPCRNVVESGCLECCDVHHCAWLVMHPFGAACSVHLGLPEEGWSLVALFFFEDGCFVDHGYCTRSVMELW